MNIKKWVAVGWLLVTILPILYFPLSMVMLTGDMWGEPSDSYEKRFDTLFDYAIILNGLLFLLTASYIIYMFATPYVPREKRLLWVVVLLFVNIIAMPFFWYWYVWCPRSTPPSLETDAGKRRPSNTVPILIGLGMFSIIPMLMLYAGYSQGHAYSDIADAFPVSDASKYSDIVTGRVSISKQNYAKGTISVGEILQVSMSDSSIRFSPSGLAGLLYRSFEIPKTAVHSCSKQCGGSTDYILLLDQMDTQIRIEDAKSLLGWCWDNQLPILASSQRREWLYKGANLPPRDILHHTLRNKVQFDYAAKQACLGY